MCLAELLIWTWPVFFWTIKFAFPLKHFVKSCFCIRQQIKCIYHFKYLSDQLPIQWGLSTYVMFALFGGGSVWMNVGGTKFGPFAQGCRQNAQSPRETAGSAASCSFRGGDPFPINLQLAACVRWRRMVPARKGERILRGSSRTQDNFKTSHGTTEKLLLSNLLGANSGLMWGIKPKKSSGIFSDYFSSWAVV